MITVTVSYRSDAEEAYELRRLFCEESAKEPVESRNPLVETNFNELVNALAQTAFDEGRNYQRNNPDKE